MSNKRRIMDDYNAKDCEQCSSDTVCCNCQNLAWYKLEEQLKAKEQECGRLQNIIDEAKNSKLDLKSFLIGEAIQNEYEERLKQLEVELQKYKNMEAKGLEEFKDVGGCWGCGIQSSLNEVTKEFLQYKASKQASYEALQARRNELELGNRKLKIENEELKEKIKLYKY